MFTYFQQLDEDIEVMVTDLDGGGLRRSEQTIKLSRYMVRAETQGQRLQLLRILQVSPSKLLHVEVEYESDNSKN